MKEVLSRMGEGIAGPLKIKDRPRPVNLSIMDQLRKVSKRQLYFTAQDSRKTIGGHVSYDPLSGYAADA